jgi:SSS family solute:Na+ symporter
MGGVLGLWRGISQNMFMTLVPILVFTVLHHPDWLGFARGIDAELATIDNAAVRDQMRGPLVLAALLPPGLMGAFAALMLGAFISTHNTYLHSWSSIFIQDVVIPFRRTPLTPKAHLRLLRGGVLGVAVFIFLFSLLYKQSQAILLFFALTGAIFAGWSGAVIIGGLYTRWGTTAAAWAASTVGVGLTLGGFILEQSQRSWREAGVAFWGMMDWAGPGRAVDAARWVDAHLPNGQELWGWAMWSCTGVYLAVSLLQKLRGRPAFDLDRLLHRGRYEIAGEVEDGTALTTRGWRALAVNREFSRRDKFLYLLTYGYNLGWVVIFVAATIFFLTRPIEGGDWSRYDALWLGFWHTRQWIEMGISVVVIVWFTIGGVRDVKALLRALDERKRDEADDGFIPRDA